MKPEQARESAERLINWKESDCLGAQCIDERCKAAATITLLLDVYEAATQPDGDCNICQCTVPNETHTPGCPVAAFESMELPE